MLVTTQDPGEPAKVSDMTEVWSADFQPIFIQVHEAAVLVLHSWLEVSQKEQILQSLRIVGRWRALVCSAKDVLQVLKLAKRSMTLLLPALLLVDLQIVGDQTIHTVYALFHRRVPDFRRNRRHLAYARLDAVDTIGVILGKETSFQIDHLMKAELLLASIAHVSFIEKHLVPRRCTTATATARRDTIQDANASVCIDGDEVSVPRNNLFLCRKVTVVNLHRNSISVLSQRICNAQF